MLYENMTAELPKSRRIRKQNGNRYVYQVMERKGVKGSKKDVVLLVGKLTADGKRMIPNDRYFEVHKEAGKPDPVSREGCFDTQSRIGALAALSHIARETGLDRCLSLAFGEDSGLILSLAYCYTLSRDSAAQLYSDFMFDHYGIETSVASEPTISRLFNARMTEEKIDMFRSSWLKRRCVESAKRGEGKTRLLVDVDSTNVNVSSPNTETAEFGKPKVDEDLPQANFAYFYDRTTGTPYFYDCFYGSITDLSYMRTGLDAFLARLGEERKPETAFILDRGYFSGPNLVYLQGLEEDFAVMGKSTAFFRDSLRENRERLKSSASLISEGSYGIRIEGKPFRECRSGYAYIFFDSAKETEERAGIENSLLAAKRALEGKRKDAGGNLKRTYSRYLDIEEDADGRILSAKADTASVDEMLSRAGFFWIFSSMEAEPGEMLSYYRERDDVEKSFSFVKSQSDFSKTYAQNERALRSKMVLAFVCAVLRCEVNGRIREIKASKTHASLTTQKALLSLDRIIMTKIGKAFYQKFALTAEQKEVMNAIGVKESDIKDIIGQATESLEKGTLVV